MTVKECYEGMGGNYQEVLGRLRDDNRITKFLTLFLNDPSFKLLEDSLASGNAQEAFRAAHTIKGVCLNLSITRLFNSSNDLTESLRGKSEIRDEAKGMVETVKKDYLNTIDWIQRLKNQG